MQKKESYNLDQELTDKVVRVAYGDAGIAESIYILLKSATNKKVKELLKEFRYTADKVHNIKQVNIPILIIDAVKNNTKENKQNGNFVSSLSNVFFLFFGKKAIPATVLSIILVLVISFVLLKEPAPTHKYSKAQVEIAERQFRKSLAIVGKALQTAEKRFSIEVINKQINKNLNRGYYLVNNILTGG